MVHERPSVAIGETEQSSEVAVGLDWQDAYETLARTDAESGLSAEDLELLATAAFLTGDREESRRARMRAYRVYVQRGDSRRAARCALRIGLDRVSAGEITRAGGCLPASISSCTAWRERAAVHLADETEGPEQGYLLITEA